MNVFEAEIKQSQPMAYAVYNQPQLYIQALQPFPPLYAKSGTVTADLLLIQPGDRFEPSTSIVRGLPYSGTLRNFSGVAVREVGEIVDKDGAWGDAPGAQHGFILDFGGMRSILRLLRTGSTLKYALVLPWQGTDFALGPLYPAQNGSYPNRLPDADGAARISLRGAESQKLYVQIHGNLNLDQFLDACVLETLVFPANLRASVGDRPPFWTHPGPLQGEAGMTGLAEALTSLAADLTAPLAPKLTLQSDAPGVLELPESFAFLSAEKGAAASWAGSPSTALALRAGVPGVFPMHFPLPEDGKVWELRSLKLEAAAVLSPWIAESVTPDPGGAASGIASIRIDARLSAGQNFPSGPGMELHGVGLHLASSADAELSVELVSDDAGRPAGGAALASRMLTASGPAAWYEVLFDGPLLLDPGRDFWIVAKAKSGAAQWGVAPALEPTASPGLPLPSSQSALYAEDGTAWQPYPRMLPVAPASVAAPAAGLRVFRAPRPEENQARVTVSHANGTSVVEMALPVSDQAVETEWLWPAANRPLLAPAADGRSIELDIRSRSSGSLEIGSATVFFAWKEA
jgi:hypothetical protein